MPVFVEIWFRRKGDTDHRCLGVEELPTSPKLGDLITISVDGQKREVVVDSPARPATTAATATPLWVTRLVAELIVRNPAERNVL